MPSPFDPTPTPDTPQASMPSAPQGAPDTTQQAGGWRDWIGRPDNRAALMQFGIAMLQPVGVGETPLSHAAGAVGHAGEAAGRVQGQELKEREVSSKEDLRSAQANAAEARATTAGARSDTAAARLGIAQQGLDLKQQQMDANNRIRAMLGYQGYLKQHAQQALINPGQGEPMGMEDWAASRGIPVGPLGGGQQQKPPDPQDVERVRAALSANPNDPQVQALAQALRARGASL
jgi:hypothetical protein